MKKNLVEIKGGVARNPLVRLKSPIYAEIGTGEHIAIVGPNGVGKSVLVDTLLGKYPLIGGKITYDFTPSPSSTVYDNVKYITFRDSYGTADAHYYYQQRWNSTDQEDAPTVREQLGKVDDEALCHKLFRLFGIEELMDKKIILLSSGELRKFQLIKALLTTPRILIIDNPFIGLDTEARAVLNTLLEKISTLKHLQIILVLTLREDIPGFITHIIPLRHKIVGPKLERDNYIHIETLEESQKINPPKYCTEFVKKTPENDASQEIVRLNNVSICYADRIILNKLDLVVHQGEKWALTGANGSGKSTLLSLICADNPQSYACDISLFGRKRGTGESIWDIKKRIGYVSPEMHRAYLKNIPAIEIVASGLHDSVGLYKRPAPGDLLTCECWMDTLGIASLKDRPFLQLSSGEQRMVLLVRAFVKDPELLILDEPYHGLDAGNSRRAKEIVEAFCRRSGKTLMIVTHNEEELPQAITHKLRLEKRC